MASRKKSVKKYTIKDLLAYYDGPHMEKYGEDAPKHLDELFEATQKEHLVMIHRDKTKREYGQAWKGFLGSNVEKLLQHILRDKVASFGLAIADGKSLERKLAKNLTAEQAALKQNLSIHYGALGSVLPDADIVLYERDTRKVVAVISSKTSLRERVAQTAYWRVKLASQTSTAHIKTYLFTLDKDGAFREREAKVKPRMIAEGELDCTYVMSAEPFEASDKIKPFADFFDDLRRLVGK